MSDDALTRLEAMLVSLRADQQLLLTRPWLDVALASGCRPTGDERQPSER